MDSDLKKILKAVVLAMRHELEGHYDKAGKWFPGDLEQRLAEIGVRKDRESAPADELALANEDVAARKIIDAYISLRQQAGVDRADAVTEYVRESAYTWANRLVALRCMEARELLDDEVIVGREAYGGRSLVHHRLAQVSPELCAGEDDGRFAMLFGVFAERAETLPMLFDPESPSIALRPSPPALKNCLAWLSGSEKVRSHAPATDSVFAAPDALGWAYQYWNTEEKDRVFETVRTKKGAKIEGADIIPATQLYTEDYMVKFLVQNSLGATWMGMHPESQLPFGSPRPASGRGAGGEGYGPWEYYVRDADRAPVKHKPLRQITLLDPACGSGHFLIEAFDLFYAMYEEAIANGWATGFEEKDEGGRMKDEQVQSSFSPQPSSLCQSILENNLFGIDIDERAIQIAEASLWMKAEERSFGFSGATTNLVAATSSHLKGESWERYLAKLEKEPSTVRVLRAFAREVQHIDELGSLARPAEALESIIKEEHERWEQQERERREADKSLFQEIRDDLLASQLPFQDISDKEFYERTMRHALFAIDGFTAEARESGEFDDQLMGVEAKTGFRLLDLLNRKYDVVVANPPYMGSKNMGPVLRPFVEKHFRHGKRDLYAAFIQRSLTLLSNAGRLAMIVPQTWLFAKAYDRLRLVESGDRKEGIVVETAIEALVQLGRHAFSEADPPSNVVMFALASCRPRDEHRLQCFRLAESRPSAEQAGMLRDACRESRSFRSIPRQLDFASLPNSPIVYYLHPCFYEKLRKGQHVADVAFVKQGLATANKERFIRSCWEVSSSSRWLVAAHGGGFGRWWGPNSSVVEWGNNGTRIRLSPGVRIQSEQFYRSEGYWYAQVARGSLGVRQLWPESMFTNISSGVFPFERLSNDSRNSLQALLNSRVANYLLRALSQKPVFSEGYPPLLPVPVDLIVEDLVDFVVSSKKSSIRKTAITEPDFASSEAFTELVESNVKNLLLRVFAQDALRNFSEGLLDRLVCEAMHLPDDAIAEVMQDTGLPAGWQKLVAGYDQFPSFDDDEQRVPNRTRKALESFPREELTHDETDHFSRLIKDALYNGTGIEVVDGVSDEQEDEDDEAVESASGIPVRSDSFLEEISRHVGLNPISVFWFISEGINGKGWTPTVLLRDFVSDALSTFALKVLGHAWRDGLREKQQHVDEDGIVPLLDKIGGEPIHERFSRRLNNTVSMSFVESSIDTSIDKWFQRSFFSLHLSQFKKRPIAWQLQTSSFTSRKTPAFACLVYYHRMDVDAIPKIRSQYTGPLKLRFETEMRGISSTPAAARTDNQAKRAVELEESLTELQAFDEKLASVAKSGFGPDKLLPKLRQYAFDDAMLSTKARWLKKLSLLLKDEGGGMKDERRDEGGGMKDEGEHGWIFSAFSLQPSAFRDLHPSLEEWVADALSHLDFFCSQVGPAAPDAKKTPDDPTAADFAELIGIELATMQVGSIKLACAVWWGKFDAAVLAPIRDRAKRMKAEGGRMKGKDEGRGMKDEEDAFELDSAALSPKDRVAAMKAEVKRLTKELKDKTAAAQTIRDAIQAYRLPLHPSSLSLHPSSLPLHPLFDAVASLDERRSPPKTIAEFIDQESLYAPDINDGVRVNIAPLQKAGVLAADVLAAKDIDKAIADRAEWRSDERRWVREGKLPQCGWWTEQKAEGGGMKDE